MMKALKIENWFHCLVQMSIGLINVTSKESFDNSLIITFTTKNSNEISDDKSNILEKHVDLIDILTEEPDSASGEILVSIILVRHEKKERSEKQSKVWKMDCRKT